MDAEWLKTVMTSGTISDKLSARTLMIQVMSDIMTEGFAEMNLGGIN